MMVARKGEAPPAHAMCDLPTAAIALWPADRPMQLSDRAALAAAAFCAGVVAAEALRWLLRRRTGAHAALLMAKAPPESTIRLMTRLAIKHGAVNLSQGFPNEPPPTEMLAAGAGALLAGENLAAAEAMGERLKAVMMVEAEKDQLNQYSFPFGMPLLRERLQAYFAAFYPEIPADADKNITVVLGATEGFAVCLRALCAPGDNVAFFSPSRAARAAHDSGAAVTPREGRRLSTTLPA